MIWLSNINDLQYYHPIDGVPCYCDQLIFPSDMLLQAVLPTNATSGFGVTVYVYSADGLTLYEDATTYFQYYIAQNPVTGSRFINLRLKSFSPTMCTHACYIIRLVVTQGGTSVFDKFTERYCQNSCCDIPRGIIITQDGVEDGNYRVQVATPTPTTPIIDPRTTCGQALIQVRTVFDCYSSTGDYYGTPGTVYTGTASFTFQKVVNISAKLVQRPREINRQISYNCKLQRSESFRPWVLESKGWTAQSMFPTWKMNEIEDMFEANHIYINDFVSPEREFQWAGGTLFTQVYKCWEVFKLSATLQDCTHRNDFGCGENCDTSRLYFSLTGNLERFYSESRQLVAENYADFLTWFRGQGNVAEVEDLSGDYSTLSGAFAVTTSGLVPTSFYVDGLTPRHRVFSTTAITEPIIACPAPTVGSITVTVNTCPAPTIGTIAVEDVTDVTATVSIADPWVAGTDPSAVIVASGSGSLTLDADNLSYPDSEAPYYLGGEIVAIIGPAGRPSGIVNITHDDDGQIPEGSVLSIDPNGIIRWFGQPVDQETDRASIHIYNIQYPM